MEPACLLEFCYAPYLSERMALNGLFDFISCSSKRLYIICFPIYKIYNIIFLASKKWKLTTLFYENVFVNVFFWSYIYQQLLINNIHVIPSFNKTLTFQLQIYTTWIKTISMFSISKFCFYILYNTYLSRPFLSCLISHWTFLLMNRFIVENKNPLGKDYWMLIFIPWILVTRKVVE